MTAFAYTSERWEPLSPDQGALLAAQLAAVGAIAFGNAAQRANLRASAINWQELTDDWQMIQWLNPYKHSSVSSYIAKPASADANEQYLVTTSVITNNGEKISHIEGVACGDSELTNYYGERKLPFEGTVDPAQMAIDFFSAFKERQHCLAPTKASPDLAPVGIDGQRLHRLALQPLVFLSNVALTSTETHIELPFAYSYRLASSLLAKLQSDHQEGSAAVAPINMRGSSASLGYTLSDPHRGFVTVHRVGTQPQSFVVTTFPLPENPNLPLLVQQHRIYPDFTVSDPYFLPYQDIRSPHVASALALHLEDTFFAQTNGENLERDDDMTQQRIVDLLKELQGFPIILSSNL